MDKSEIKNLTQLYKNLTVQNTKLPTNPHQSQEIIDGHRIIPSNTHVITNWSSSQYQYFTSTVKYFNYQTKHYKIEWDDQDPSGTDVPINEIVVNLPPNPSDVEIGSPVFFAQGEYVADAKLGRTSGFRWHRGKILRKYTEHGKFYFDGCHTYTEDDGKWCNYKDYKFEFEKLSLDFIRLQKLELNQREKVIDICCDLDAEKFGKFMPDLPDNILLTQTCDFKTLSNCFLYVAYIDDQFLRNSAKVEGLNFAKKHAQHKILIYDSSLKQKIQLVEKCMKQDQFYQKFDQNLVAKFDEKSEISSIHRAILNISKNKSGSKSGKNLSQMAVIYDPKFFKFALQIYKCLVKKLDPIIEIWANFELKDIFEDEVTGEICSQDQIILSETTSKKCDSSNFIIYAWKP